MGEGTDAGLPGVISPGAALPGAALPGAELIHAGLDDLAHGRETIEALLLSIGAPRLGLCGIEVANPFADPEHRLYALLAATDSDSAHSRYNALIRRPVSFERAAACVR